MKQWDPDTAVLDLAEPDQAFLADTNWDDPAQAQNAVGHIFRVNAKEMALSIVHIGLYDPNSRVRFQAAQYVLNEVMKAEGGESDPLTRMVSELTELVKYGADPTSG